MSNGIEDAVQPGAGAAAAPPAKAHVAPRSTGRLAFSDRIFLAIENPVLRRELLTALRSNKAFFLQGVYLFLLGIVVCWAWPEHAIATGDALTRKLFHVFGQSQLVLISIMAPAFSASAMTIEKERRCIDLLLTSPIRPGTILMGKYLSAIVYLVLLILSTAPLVSVMIWLPGLGPMEFAGMYVLLLAVALCFGMIGLSCSVFFHRSQASLAITYMIVLPLALVLLACAISFDGFFVIENALWPSAMLLAAAVVMYRACAARLRQPFDPVFKAAEEEDVAAQTGLVLVQDRFPDNLLAPARNGQLLPDNVNPVYQKEIRSEIFGRGTLFLRLIIQISMFLSVVFLTFLYLGREHIFADYLVIFTMLIAPAFACNTFTQERERGTLDLLLTTLVRPGQIIWGKLLACLRISLFLTGLVGVTMCFYLFVGSDSLGDRIAYLSVYIAILLVTVLFETLMAMFLSLIFKSSIQSMITSYAVVLALYGVPLAADELFTAFTQKSRSEIAIFLFMSPFEAIYSVSSKTLGSSGMLESKVALWPYYLLLYGGASVLLLALVHFVFERHCSNAVKTR